MDRSALNRNFLTRAENRCRESKKRHDVKNVDDDSSNVFDLEFVQDGQLDVKNEFVDQSASPNVETDIVVNSDNVLQRHPQEAFNRRIRKPKVSFFAADKMLGRFLFILVPQRVSLKFPLTKAMT